MNYSIEFTIFYVIRTETERANGFRTISIQGLTV